MNPFPLDKSLSMLVLAVAVGVMNLSYINMVDLAAGMQ